MNKHQLPYRRMIYGYALLIALAMVQELLVYFNVYLEQSFSLSDLTYSLAALAALLLGLVLPAGVSVVLTFVYLVAYFVWLATFADTDALTISWLLLLPANILAAALIKVTMIRSRRFTERLRQLEQRMPEVDLDTELGNKPALAEAVIKHSNLAKRYPEQYSFCLAMLRIDFLPLLQESLGSKGYAALLLELSTEIQQELRYEDYKFSIDEGRFVLLLPMTSMDHLKLTLDRIKQALMKLPLVDQKGRQLNLVIRSGALVFTEDQFSKYENINVVVAALERNTETDLIGEYI
ncbi:GGDEF domain-containing protein [Paenibacillus sp. 1P07SE]|uniref:GGDEF domain-containing protein n=1 Tax=Paenibacillus sp. 1P07SE TaxID=3132209 RepID=UPI0039A56CBF